MSKRIGMAVAVVVMLCVMAAAAGGFWFLGAKKAPVSRLTDEQLTLDIQQLSYVTLDKIVVMLKTDTELRRHNSYISVDLVLRTDKLHEKATKGELPMLKGVAVRTLSQLSLDQAKAMGIDQWTELLHADLMAAYAANPDLRPFDKVLVSRLIIE